MTWNYKFLIAYTVHTSAIATDKGLTEHCGETTMNLALEERL